MNQVPLTKLREAGLVTGERSALVGKDVIHSIIVTGNHNQAFVGDYERLRDAYIQPWSVFERVGLDNFTGREWLTAEIDAFLRDNDRGYFILEAKAGLGKTTFLAHLSRERGYIHHFVELAPGQDGVIHCLKNITAQVMRAWMLNPHVIEEILPQAASRPDFLQNLLFEASHRRDEVKPGEKIVLIVDALDEAGRPPGQNVLGLPKVLPAGVYLIVSQRPVDVPLAGEGPRRVLKMEATDELNLADMRAYLEQAAAWDGVRHALQEKSYTNEHFVEILLEKCCGVWIYLHYVIGEIERGERTPLDLDTLPQGVWQYYAEYWDHHWRSPVVGGQKQKLRDWDEVYLPLLSTLAAVQQEDVSLAHLCDLAGVEMRADLQFLMEERWAPFLSVTKGDVSKYRLYHGSLRDFLNGRVDLSELRSQEQTLTLEMSEATRHAHSRIANRYIDAWGGLESCLPGLRKLTWLDAGSLYGLRHLAAHLEGAHRYKDLHMLLEVEWHDTHETKSQSKFRSLLNQLFLQRQEVRAKGHCKNAWYTIHEQGGDVSSYLSNINRAWHLAEKSSLESLNQGKEATNLGFEVRYALITTSINSVAKNIPPILLIKAVEKGVLSLIQGLAYAQLAPALEQRAKMFTGLVPHAPEPLRGETIKRAVVATMAIKRGERRAEILAELAPHLPKELQGEVLGEAIIDVKSIRDGERGTEALIALIPCLPESLLGQALEAAQALATSETLARENYRMKVLATLASRLPEPLLSQGLNWTKGLQREKLRAEALAALGPHLSEPLLREALLEADVFEVKGHRAWVLANLAPYLSDELRQQTLMKAVLAAKELMVKENQVRAIAALVPHLPEPLRGEALGQAVSTAKELGGEDSLLAILPTSKKDCVEAFAALAPHLSEPLKSELLKQAVAIAHMLANRDEYAETISVLMPHLPNGLKKRTLKDAIAVAKATKSEKARVEALATLASHLPEPLKGKTMEGAIAEAMALKNGEDRVEALAALAPHLPELLKDEVMKEAVAATKAISFEEDQFKAFASLAPHLSPALLNQALISFQKIEDYGDYAYRAKAIMALAPHLPESLKGEALEHAIAMAMAVKSEEFFVKTVTVLAPYLSEQQLERTLEAVRGVKENKHRAAALAALAPHLPEPRRIKVFRAAIATIKAIRNGDLCAESLAALAPHLPEALQAEALEGSISALEKTESEEFLAKTVALLAPHLSGALLERTLEAVRGVKENKHRAAALAALAPHLPGLRRGEALEWAFATTRANFFGSFEVKTLIALMPHLPEKLRKEALKNAYDTATQTESKRHRAETLIILAPHLPEPSRTEALELGISAVNKISSMTERADAIAALAPYLQEPSKTSVLTTVITTVTTMWNEAEQAVILTTLAPHLPEELLQQAIVVANGILNRTYRVEALTALAARLPDPAKGEVVEKIFAEVMMMDFEDGYGRALAVLAPHLPVPTRGKALKVAMRGVKKIRSAADRAQFLASVAPHLTEPLQSETLREAVATLKEIGKGREYIRTLVVLLFHLPEPLKSEALEDSIAIVKEISSVDRAAALAALAPHLPEPLLEQALAVAQEMLNEFHRAEALSALAPYLPEPLQTKALTNLAVTTRNMNFSDSLRANVLTTLAPHLPEVLKGEALEEAITAARVIKNEEFLAKTVAILAPHLSGALLERAFEAAQGIENDQHRVEALAALAPRLPESQRGEALEWAFNYAKKIEGEDARVNAFAALAPHLPEKLFNQMLELIRVSSSHSESTSVLAMLVPNLVRLPPRELYSFWAERLHGKTTHLRKDLLNDLSVISPLVYKLGGAKAIMEVYRSIRDVLRWWP